MNERQKELLKAIVENYIKEAKPIGSKSLCKKFKCSSATIRNEMGDLEHFGFMPTLYEEAYSEMDMDSCLCQADLDETFKKNDIPFKTDCMDYFVGQLELLSF